MPVDTAPPPQGFLDRMLGHALEGCMYLVVLGTPWAFGAVVPYELYAFLGVGLMLLLWSARILVAWQVRWHQCPLVLGLAALFLIGMIQILPLPAELLRAASPEGQALVSSLLPRQQETLAAEFAREEAPTSPGVTISLYPGGTKSLLVRLLGLFLFFVCVRNNCASIPILRRLSLLAVLNGAALAFVSTLQYLTSDAKHLYWVLQLPHQGIAFGPFLNRNHYPFYMNMCIGLGVGLLFSLRYHAQGYLPPGASRTARPGGLANLDENPYQLTHPPLLLRSWSEILHDGRVLWLCFPLALMICSVLCSLSRGGVASLIIALLLGLTIGLPAGNRRAGLLTLFVLGGGVFFLLSWFGFDILETRLASLAKADALNERLAFWRSSWRAAQDFLRLGSGYGTFMFVEPMYRETELDADSFHDHAHNEYLEALLEGGIPRLAVTLYLVFATLWLARRGMTRFAHRSAEGLLMGAMIAVLAVAIHSVVDFGIHVPAIALMVTAVAAQISAVALDRDAQKPRHLEPEDDPNLVRLGGIFPPVVAAVLVAMALLVASESWRDTQVFHLRQRAQLVANNALLARDEFNRPKVVGWPVEDFAKKVRLLEAAANMAPDYAIVRLQLANAVSQLVLAYEQANSREAQLYELAQMALGGASTAVMPPVGQETFDIHLLLPIPASTQFRNVRQPVHLETLRPLLGQYLQHLLLARDLYPLLPQPHLRIAENVTSLKSGDPRSTYLRRAKRLRPVDGHLWYQCGTQQWLDGEYEEAIRDWRRALEILRADDPDMKDTFYAILIQAQRKPPGTRPDGSIASEGEPWLSATDILDRIVPDDPKLILAAVDLLLGKPADKAKRRPYLEKALALMKSPSTADEYHTAAMLHLSLDQLKEAEEQLQRALAMVPTQLDWRTTLAKLYFDQARYADAVFHLEMVAKQRPNDQEIKKQLEAAQEMAKLKKQP